MPLLKKKDSGQAGKTGRGILFNHTLIEQLREKQLKNMSRNEKISLIKEKNPTFSDLYEDILKFKKDSGQAGKTG